MNCLFSSWYNLSDVFFVEAYLWSYYYFTRFSKSKWNSWCHSYNWQKLRPAKKKYFLVARSFLFLLLYPISVFYMFPVQFSTNCNGVSLDHIPAFCTCCFQCKQRRENNLFGKSPVSLCFAVFYGFLAYRFLYNFELLLLFMKEARILKICHINLAQWS